MKHSEKLLKMTVLAMLVALGVVISPILRIEGMCPMAHFINIVCSVLLGPWYSLACALLIGIIRMATMGIPPIALTGAIFGAYLSGVFYRASKGSLLLAFLGEVIGTGIIGAIISYPVMSIFWGKEGLSLLFYVPSFICGTLIGGSIAFAFLKKLSRAGILPKLQTSLGTQSYDYSGSSLGDATAIGSLGVILFVVIKLAAGIFDITHPAVSLAAYAILSIFILSGIVFLVYQLLRKEVQNDRQN